MNIYILNYLRTKLAIYFFIYVNVSSSKLTNDGVISEEQKEAVVS